MVKISIAKTLTTFAITFASVFSFATIALSVGGTTPFSGEIFKNEWNDAFVKGDKNALSETLASLGESVKKTSVPKCDEEGFYENGGNSYFCNGGTVFVFSGKTFSESFGKTFSESFTILAVLSLTFSVLFTAVFYARSPNSFKTVSSSKFTISELDRKLTENCALYERYVTDIEDFDNSPEKNTEALFRVAYAYFFVSKRHSNNILNKLSKVKKKILDTGLEKNFAVFFSEYDAFYEMVNRETAQFMKVQAGKITDIFVGNPTVSRFIVSFAFLTVLVAFAENGTSSFNLTGTDGIFHYSAYVDAVNSILGFSVAKTVSGFAISKVSMLVLAYDFVSLAMKGNLKLK